MKEKVSIVIPIFDKVDHINRSITSTLEQSYSNLEVILIDDCNTKQSKELIEIFEKKDNRVIVYSYDKRQGVNLARKKGISLATGEYLFF